MQWGIPQLIKLQDNKKVPILCQVELKNTIKYEYFLIAPNFVCVFFSLVVGQNTCICKILKYAFKMSITTLEAMLIVTVWSLLFAF